MIIYFIYHIKMLIMLKKNKLLPVIFEVINLSLYNVFYVLNINYISDKFYFLIVNYCFIIYFN